VRKVPDKRPADMSCPDTCQLNLGYGSLARFPAFPIFPLPGRQVQRGVAARWDNGRWGKVGTVGVRGVVSIFATLRAF